MRRHELSARRPRHRTGTTASPHNAPVAPTRLNRVFTAERAQEPGGADSTGIWKSQGWRDVAVVLEMFSRKGSGWALAQRRPQARLVPQSDRGSQETRNASQAWLRVWGSEGWLSRTGDCYDHARLERCFATLTGQWTDRQRWASQAQARQAIGSGAGGILHSPASACLVILSQPARLCADPGLVSQFSASTNAGQVHPGSGPHFHTLVFSRVLCRAARLPAPRHRAS